MVGSGPDINLQGEQNGVEGSFDRLEGNGVRLGGHKLAIVVHQSVETTDDDVGRRPRRRITMRPEVPGQGTANDVVISGTALGRSILTRQLVSLLRRLLSCFNNQYTLQYHC